MNHIPQLPWIERDFSASTKYFEKMKILSLEQTSVEKTIGLFLEFQKATDLLVNICAGISVNASACSCVFKHQRLTVCEKCSICFHDLIPSDGKVHAR